MKGIGTFDEYGFLEQPSASGIIAFQYKDKNFSGGMRFAQAIADVGNRIVEKSENNIIKKVVPTTFEGSAAIEVYLKNPVEPTNLQYSQAAKKYLKLNLATKDKEWSWVKENEGSHEPRIGMFLFKICESDSEEIPIVCYAYAGKSKGTNEYIRTHHPNVSESGSICMGGYSGMEKITELSVKGLAAMLRNEAIYSSYFKPMLKDHETGKTILINSENIKNAVEHKQDEISRILSKHTTLEAWL
jgi:hypothetical protein